MSVFTEPLLSASIVLDVAHDAALRTIKCFNDMDTAVTLHVIDNAPVLHFEEKLLWLCPAINYHAQNQSLGLGGGHNAVMRLLHSKYHLFCSQDMTFHPNTIRHMLDYMDRNPGCAVLVPQILDQNGNPLNTPEYQPTIRGLLGQRFRRGIFRKWANKRLPQDQSGDAAYLVDTASPNFLLIRTSLLWQLQGFDEHFRGPMAADDLCRRLSQMGGVIALHPSFHVTQRLFDGIDPISSATNFRDTLRFFKKWGWKW